MPSTVGWCSVDRSTVSLSPEKAKKAEVLASPAVTRSARAGSVSTVARHDEGYSLPVVAPPQGQAKETPHQKAAREVVRIFRDVYNRWAAIGEISRELEAAKARREVEQINETNTEKETAQIGGEGPEGKANGSAESENVETEEQKRVKMEDNDAWIAFSRLGVFSSRPKAKQQHDTDDVVDVAPSTDGKAIPPPTWLARYHYGHVLTRIVCKGAYALGLLHEHEDELEVLETLLSQRAFRRGRRGRWHERRALILTNHVPKKEYRTEQSDLRAYVAIVEALQDPDVHLSTCCSMLDVKHCAKVTIAVFRPKLTRRFVKLHRKLKSCGCDPGEPPTINTAALQEPHRVYIHGNRLDNALALSKTKSMPTGGAGNKRRKVELDDKQQKLPFALIAPPPPAIDAPFPGKGKEREVEKVSRTDYALGDSSNDGAGAATDWEVGLARAGRRGSHRRDLRSTALREGRL